MTAQSSVQIPFPELPEGTVTFLFTDIEGSTKLLQRLREQYTTLLAEQRQILREAFTNWNGREVDTQGDAFFVAFSRATQAVGAAAEAQRKLAEHAWPEGVTMRVRMGIHTGEPWSGEEGYVGMDVHRAARIAHVGHGGQVLLSETTTALVRDELPAGVSLFDLGRHLLKDIHRPERICQLVIEGLPAKFPPLTTLEALPPEGARLPRQTGKCPYLGLSAFQEMDAPFYFGRETFITALVQAVRTRKLVAVIVGSSGSGKSSVLFAGLLPRLRKEGGYQFATFRPGSQPFYSLAGALLPLLESGLSESDHLVETRKLAERLENGEINLAQVAERILEKAPETRQVLLVVDQFEELYTLCPDAELQKAFIDELLATLEAHKARRNPSSVILVTLRADFMGQALAYRPFADALQEASLLMGPMTRQELHMAIEKPAEMQGAVFEPGLVERILDDVGEKAGNLPLLQFTLTQLWEQQTDGWLTHANYEGMGSVEGALAAYADRVYAGLEADEQERARRALVQLVQPGEGTEDTRRVATREELGDESWKLIQYLADRRLVVTGRDAAGNETTEVVHEALIQKWGRFQEWMNADRLFRAWQERLRGSQRQWQESGQDEGALLSGAPLAVAQNWVSERGAELSPPELGYIQASQAQQSQRQKALERRRQRTILALVTGLVLVTVLGVIALFARQQASRSAQIALAEANTRATAEASALQQRQTAEEQANLASSRELAAAAVNNLEVDPERSILLALEALKKADTLEAQGALHQAILASRLVASIPADSQSVFGVAVSPDGSKFASAGMDGVVKIWAMNDFSALSGAAPLLVLENPIDFEVQLETGGYTLAFSPDGSRLAVIAEKQSAKIYDVSSGQLLQTLSSQAGNVYGLAFDPDGKRLVTTSAGGKAVVWDVLIGNELSTVTVPDYPIYGAIFTPDGKGLITGSDDAVARFWDLDDKPGTELFSLSFDYSLEGPPGAFAFSPDGKFLAIGTGQVARVWDFQALQATPTIKPLFTLYGHQNNNNSLAYTSDGTRLVTGNADGTAKVWDAATGQELFTLAGGTGTINSLAISPDGIHPVSAHGDGQVRIWDISPTGSHEWWAIHPAHRGRISPDGRRLATGYKTSELTGETLFQLWELAPSGITEVNSVTVNPEARVSAYGFSPDLSRNVTIDANSLLNLWDPASGQLLQSFPINQTETSSGHSDFVFGFAFSPDGAHCATGGDEGLAIIWDLASGKPLLVLTGHAAPVRSVDFSPDGTRLATADLDGTTRIWDSTSGQLLQTLSGHAGFIADVEFSRDGKRLLTGSNDTTAKVWDVLTGQELLTLKGHASTIFFVDFNPDGTHLVTGSTDGSAKVWDASTGQVLLTLPGFWVEFLPDGKSLVTISIADQTGRGFYLDVQELINLARSRVTRSLTQAECQQYLHLEVCPTSLE